ncbi:MAG TPA: periplasmic heavy metal sensor [bacterium]|nr:periplasmic heavy metal sensor [bacterium]
MKKNLGFSILLLTMVLGGTCLWADAPSATPAAPRSGEATQPRLTRKELMDKLQVTREQKALLRKNRAAYRKQIAVLEGQFKVKRVELENEIEKPEPDPDRIDQLTSEIGALLAKKYSAQIKAELEIEKNILTPQQVDQLRSLQSREVFVPNDIF